MLTIKSISGDRYYISCDEQIQKKDKLFSAIVERGTEELFCGDTTVEGVYYYGCRQLVDTWEHAAGYIWSSRPSCINGQFGTQLAEVIINNSALWAMDINILKNLVAQHTGKDYYVEEYYSPYDKNKEEPHYRLIENK